MKKGSALNSDISEEVVIKIQKNMAYHVVGPAKLVDSEGNEFDLPGGETWLCRCGNSSTKPFCDGNGHRKAGFRSDPKAADQD